MRPDASKARTPAPAQEDSGSTLLLMLVGGRREHGAKLWL